jgi:hypothetical protein
VSAFSLGSSSAVEPWQLSHIPAFGSYVGELLACGRLDSACDLHHSRHVQLSQPYDRPHSIISESIVDNVVLKPHE